MSAGAARGVTNGSTSGTASSTLLAMIGFILLPERATSAVMTMRPVLTQNPSPSTTVIVSFTASARSRSKRAACLRTSSLGSGTPRVVIDTET